MKAHVEELASYSDEDLARLRGSAKRTKYRCASIILLERDKRGMRIGVRVHIRPSWRHDLPWLDSGLGQFKSYREAQAALDAKYRDPAWKPEA